MKKFKDTAAFIKEKFSTDDYIPLHAPVFIGNEKKYLTECINSTFVSSVGEFVEKFEKEISKFTGSKRAVLCVNGTSAIHLSLTLLNISYNDEVLTQPLTFIATTNAISYNGAHPIFIDVDKDTMGMSPNSLLKFLKEFTIVKDNTCFNKITNRKIKACLPMHTFGHACKIDKIIEICNNYKIDVIEDAAESMGSYYKGKHLGSYGKLGTISFNGNKIMTAGGGGVIITDNDELADKAKHLSTQAKIPHAWEYNHDHIGYNYRMPNLNAALGLAQLEKMPYFLKQKRLLASDYSNFFKKQNINFFDEYEYETSNYWLNAIILKDKAERDIFLNICKSNKILSRPIWNLINKSPMYNKCQSSDLSNSNWLESRVVNIPSSVII